MSERWTGKVGMEGTYEILEERAVSGVLLVVNQGLEGGDTVEAVRGRRRQLNEDCEEREGGEG